MCDFSSKVKWKQRQSTPGVSIVIKRRRQHADSNQVWLVCSWSLERTSQELARTLCELRLIQYYEQITASLGSGITKDQTYTRIRKKTSDSREREHNSIQEEQTDGHIRSKQKSKNWCQKSFRKDLSKRVSDTKIRNVKSITGIDRKTQDKTDKHRRKQKRKRKATMGGQEKLLSLKEEVKSYQFWKAVRCEFLITLLYVFVGESHSDAFLFTPVLLSNYKRD